MANERLTLSTIFNASGNLSQKLRENGRSISQFVQRANSRLQVLNIASKTASRGFDLLRSRAGGLVASVAAATGFNFLVNLEERFESLAVQAGITTEEVEKLKQAIFDTSQEIDIKIDPDQLTSAISEIVERTGDLRLAETNIRNLAMAIRATGAQGADIGALVAEFKKLGITTERDVLLALDTLIKQGKAGAFTLGNLATQGARVVSAIASMGFQGKEAVKQMGALLQVSMMGTGSADRAATAFEAMLRQIKTNAEELEAEGVVIRDPIKLEQGVEQFRPIPEILDEIIKKAQGSGIVLQKVFGDEGGRAINQLAIDFKRSGTLETLERFLALQGDGNELMQDSARLAKTASGTIEAVFSKTQETIDASVTPVMRFLNDLQNRMHLLGTALDNSLDGVQTQAASQQPEATVRIQIDQAGRANVKSIDARGINVVTDTGRIMESP